MVGNQWLDWGEAWGGTQRAERGMRGSFIARVIATQQISDELSRAPGCLFKASTQTAWMIIK